MYRSQPRSECYGSCSKLVTEDHGKKSQSLWRARITQEHKWGGRSRNYKSGHVCSKIEASIDLTLLTIFQAFSGIKGNHSDAIGRCWHKDRCPLRSLILTMHHKHCRLDFCRPRQVGVFPTGHVIFSDESKFNFSAYDHCTCVGRQPGQWSDSVFVVEWHTAIT